MPSSLPEKNVPIISHEILASNPAEEQDVLSEEQVLAITAKLDAREPVTREELIAVGIAMIKEGKLREFYNSFHLMEAWFESVTFDAAMEALSTQTDQEANDLRWLAIERSMKLGPDMVFSRLDFSESFDATNVVEGVLRLFPGSDLDSFMDRMDIIRFFHKYFQSAPEYRTAFDPDRAFQTYYDLEKEAVEQLSEGFRKGVSSDVYLMEKCVLPNIYNIIAEDKDGNRYGMKFGPLTKHILEQSPIGRALMVSYPAYFS